MHTENQMGFFSLHSFISLIACIVQFQKGTDLEPKWGVRCCMHFWLFYLLHFLYPKQGGVGQAPGPLPCHQYPYTPTKGTEISTGVGAFCKTKTF